MTKKITHSSGCIPSLLKQKMKLLVVAAALVSGGLQAQTVVTLTTASTSPWTCPSNVATMTVECWGGGGAGGSVYYSGTAMKLNTRGGGGAGGGYAKEIFANPAATTYPFAVGAGALAPLADGTLTDLLVRNGASTTFGTSTIVAVGGNGGQSRVPTTTAATHGLGGAKVTSGNTGSVMTYGGAGAAGVTGTPAGGGGSAGSGGDGGDAIGATGGLAGTGGGIAGANGKTGATLNTGANGNPPGAGGSGAYLAQANATALGSKIGGNGGAGLIKISYIFNEPTAQASGINFTVVGSDAMTINWTNGNADVAPMAYGRAVFVKEGTGSITAPVDGTAYTANTNWSTKGTQLGTSGYYCVYNGTSNTVSLTVLNPSQTYTVYVYEYSISNTYYNFETTGVNATQATTAAVTPFITLSAGTLTAFSNTFVGDYTAEQTFTVEGINLTDDITVTAPTGFKVSKTTGSGFASSVVYAQASGTVSTQNVYVRFEPTAIQAFTGNISCTSTDAATRVKAVSGTGTDPKPSISIISPVTNSTAGAGASLVLTATAIPTGSRTISANDVIFKYGSTPFTGTVTKSGNNFSITTNDLPSGVQSITAVATDNQSNATTSAAITVKGVTAYTGDKYAQSAITSWKAGPWYDAATAGNEVTYPTAGDNVFTNGIAVTVDVDETCDNLTFTSLAGQIGIAAAKTLTVRGQVDCTAAGALDAFSTSNATSILKLTGETLASPFLLVTDNAVTGMRPKNLVIEAVNTANTYNFGVTGVSYQHGTAAFTVKGGTKLNIKPTMYFGSTTDYHFVVEENAEVTATNSIRWNSSAYSQMTKITVSGSLTCANTLNAITFIFGNNATLKTAKADMSINQIQDGWWGNGGGETSFGKPSSITMGTNTTIEYNKAGNQNINGIVPVTTPYSIPYVNLKLSGSGTKTVRSNLTASKTLDIASGVTMVIPTGITLTIPSGAVMNIAAGGKITNEGTIVNEGTINYLSDASNGTATYIGEGTISGLGTTKVNQYLTTGRNWYIANPINTAVSPTVASGTITLNKYDEAIVTDAVGATGWSVTTEALAVGKGYVATVSADGNITFTGTLNNGDTNISLTSRTGTANKAGFNLFGNPYPSYLDWSLVAANTANAALLRSNTLWYRTKKLNQASELVYQFQTVNGDGVSVPNDGSAVIPPMQSFWVRAVESVVTPIVVTNAMRSHAPASDKLMKAPAARNTARTLIRLQVSNGVNTDESIIYFSENAQNGLDKFDAPKMSNGNLDIPEIYTTLGTEKIVINSMNNMPLDTPIGLGFVAGNATDFSIKANEITNIPDGVKVMLRDNVTLAETDLTDGAASYSFTPATTSTDRFSIIFRAPGVTTDVDYAIKPSAQVFVNAANQITIIAAEKSNYAIYNAVGMMLENGILNTKHETRNTKLIQGVYLVKINGSTTKVIIK